MKKIRIKQQPLDKKDDMDAVREQLARALADYDNLKRRVENERADFMEIAKASLLIRFLPIFDMFEQVQGHVKDSGLAIALNELREKLKEENLHEIKPQTGEPFDEQTMEAVEALDKPEMEGKVVELSLKGYKLSDNILRYAKVIVGKKGTKNE